MTSTLPTHHHPQSLPVVVAHVVLVEDTPAVPVPDTIKVNLDNDVDVTSGITTPTTKTLPPRQLIMKKVHQSIHSSRLRLRLGGSSSRDNEDIRILSCSDLNLIHGRYKSVSYVWILITVLVFVGIIILDPESRFNQTTSSTNTNRTNITVSSFIEDTVNNDSSQLLNSSSSDTSLLDNSTSTVKTITQYQDEDSLSSASSSSDSGTIFQWFHQKLRMKMKENNVVVSVMKRVICS